MDEQADTPNKEVCCPKCGTSLDTDLVARVKARSEVSIRIVPPEGELLDANTVGATIQDFAKMLVAFGTHAGIPTVTLIKSLTTDEHGAMTATVLITRGPEADGFLTRRRARKAKKAMRS